MICLLPQPIECCGKVYLVLTPWHDPEALKRCWCLFEIYTCLTLGAELSICLSEEDENAFTTMLTENFDGILTNLANIDTENADAVNPEDKAKIFGLNKQSKQGFKVPILPPVYGALRHCVPHTGAEPDHHRVFEHLAAGNGEDTGDATGGEIGG